MDFTVNDEQRLLRESVRKFVHQDYAFAQRRALAASPIGFSLAHWQQFADLGWLAIPFEERVGGLGGRLADVTLLLEEFGKGLVLEPYIPTVILGGLLIQALGSDAQCERWLLPLMAGACRVALADAEHGSRGNLSRVTCRAEPEEDGYRLSGDKCLVLQGGSAQLILVVASVPDIGLGVFAVSPDAPGMTLTAYPLVDGSRAADIRLASVFVPHDAVIGEPGQVESVIQRTLDLATIALCAQAIGAMETTWRSTVEYCKTRRQFGVPIGSFQVLQHRMVDMFMAHEQAKSLLLMASLQDVADPASLSRAASALKSLVGKWGRQVGQQAIQLHGGMGMSDEMPIGYFFKHLTAVDALLGAGEVHLDRYARSICASQSSVASV